MAEAIAITVYNFVNAVLIKAGTGAILASNVAHVAAAAAATTATFAVSAAANAIIANQNKPEQQGGLIRLAISPNEPRRLIIGKRQTGGVLSDWMIKGSKNGNLAMVVYLGEGPCGALKKIYGGGRVVYDVDAPGSSAFVHGVRKVIPNFRSGGDRLWITYYDGRPGQTADPYLIAQYPGEWTTNHKGTGCAYAIVEAWWDSDNQTSVPSISFEMEGAKLYDRRKDSTAGGSGSHRHNNPATWEYSTNPAVALDHYLLGRFVGSIRTFGLGLPATDVPYAEFAALANLCDENVALKAGGTQKRYEANGFLFADRSFKDTIKDLCRAMNARPADKGGRIGIIDGQPKTPVLTLTNLDLVENTPDLYRPKQSWGELVSGVTGSYIDPRQNYQPVDFPRITNPVWDAEDNGQPKFDTIDFEMEVSQERAERLAKLFVQMKRRQARLTGTYKFRSIQLEQGDWFVRSGGKFGAGKTFEVMDRILNPKTMAVTIAAFEVDPADSAWSAASATDIVPVTEVPVPELFEVGLPTVTVTPVSFSSGDLTFPAFRFDNPDAGAFEPFGVNIEYAFSDLAPTPGPTGERFAHIMPPGQAQSTVYGLIPSRVYVVRAQSFYGTIRSAWTNWLAVSTSAVYTGGPATSIVGQGDLALLDFVHLGTNVRLANATTIATNALLQTSLGTAAAITGQGSFATLSAINDSLANSNNLLRRSAGGLFTGALAADVTALNTAAAIAGQGAFATLNSAAYGSGLLTGFGALAPLAFTNLGNNVRLADGTTIATNALLQTSLGTAAAIAGQGSFATLSAINDALANSNNLLRRSAGGLFTGALAADVTALNTAAGIAGQGALATASFTQLGSTVRLSDGVTVATNAALVTSLGTAAAIVGQGYGATASEIAVANLYASYGVRRGYNFLTALEGWTVNSAATLAWSNGVALLTGTATDPSMVSPAINLPGRQIPKIRARIRPLVASPTWEGVVYYQTAGHPFSGSFYKIASAPLNFAQNVWSIVEWDMSALTAGGTDWLDNSIISVRFDISNNPGAWEIDWIALGDFSSDPVGVRGIADNADPTGLNTAAAITGQGPLATAASVTTGVIAANAVSLFGSDSIDAGVEIPDSTWTDVASVVMTVEAGATVMLTGFWYYSAGYATATYQDRMVIRQRLVRDSTVIREQNAASYIAIAGGQGGTGSGSNGPSVVIDTDENLPAGTYTFKLQAFIDLNAIGGQNVTRNISNRLLVASQLKR